MVTTLLNITNISEAGERIYYYNDTELVVDPTFKNWKTYRCLVTCSNSMLFSSESYNVFLDKCGYGEGNCWISEMCLTY